MPTESHFYSPLKQKSIHGCNFKKGNGLTGYERLRGYRRQRTNTIFGQVRPKKDLVVASWQVKGQATRLKSFLIFVGGLRSYD